MGPGAGKSALGPNSCSFSGTRWVLFGKWPNGKRRRPEAYASLAKGAQPGVRKLHFAGEKLAEEIFAKFSNILMANEGRRLRPAWPKVRGEEVQKTKTKKVLTCIPFWLELYIYIARGLVLPCNHLRTALAHFSPIYHTLPSTTHSHLPLSPNYHFFHLPLPPIYYSLPSMTL